MPPCRRCQTRTAGWRTLTPLRRASVSDEEGPPASSCHAVWCCAARVLSPVNAPCTAPSPLCVQSWTTKMHSPSRCCSNATRATSSSEILGAGCWVLGAGCWVLGAGCWVLGAGCWVLGAGCWVLGQTPPGTVQQGKLSSSQHGHGWPQTPAAQAEAAGLSRQRPCSSTCCRPWGSRCAIRSPLLPAGSYSLHCMTTPNLARPSSMAVSGTPTPWSLLAPLALPGACSAAWPASLRQPPPRLQHPLACMTRRLLTAWQPAATTFTTVAPHCPSHPPPCSPLLLLSQQWPAAAVGAVHAVQPGRGSQCASGPQHPERGRHCGPQGHLLQRCECWRARHARQGGVPRGQQLLAWP